MKAFVFGICLASLSLPAAAKCVVEIIDGSGDPLGYIYQESECRTAMSKCKQQLSRLNVAGAKCEITLDIPGQKSAQSKESTAVFSLI